MYGFIFAFHSIYGSNLHHFGDEGRRKSRFFHITLAFDAPVRGSRRNIAKMFGAEKTRMVGLPGGKKLRICSAVSTEYRRVPGRHLMTA